MEKEPPLANRVVTGSVALGCYPFLWPEIILRIFPDPLALGIDANQDGRYNKGMTSNERVRNETQTGDKTMKTTTKTTWHVMKDGNEIARYKSKKMAELVAKEIGGTFFRSTVEFSK